MPNCPVCNVETFDWKTCKQCSKQFCFVCVNPQSPATCETLHGSTPTKPTASTPSLPEKSIGEGPAATSILTVTSDPSSRPPPVICPECKTPLKGIGLRKTCPTCKATYQKADKGWARIDVDGSSQASSSLSETWQLQDLETPINSCFKTQIDDFVRVAERAPLDYPEPKRELDGFRVRAPLLHFIWFGVPPSFSRFDAVFDWAKLLLKPWKGVCLWLEDACFQKLVVTTASWNIRKAKSQESITSVNQDDEILLLGSSSPPNCLPVYFASIEKNLKVLTFRYDSDKCANVTALWKAIDYEREHQPPLQLAQVASDIMRVIVLKFYGGAYFDFDVRPSMYCKEKGLLEPMHIPLGPDGFLCHRKGPINENDILFADPVRGAEVLNALMIWMVRFYKTPDRRAKILKELLGQALKNVDDVIAVYRKGQAPEGELLRRLAIVVEQDIHRGSKVQYPKVLDDDVATLVRLTNDSIEAATFGCFQAHIASDTNTKGWENMKRFFSEETLSKPFYSWKDPGSSKAIELIDATKALQAAIRSFLARSEAAQRKHDEIEKTK
jgi:hypothetical protein